ncbi:MAG: zinc ribbon domain-containing protein [Methanomassiliicoccus sp.]|nr:zinc ribbon domain-containing protein [Methanomassiliicoccus sp.]
MICGRCNNENPEDNLYCGRCGNTLITGNVNGSLMRTRLGITLLILGSGLLVLSFLFSIAFTYMFSISNMDWDLSPVYPVMFLLNMFGLLGTVLVILGTTTYLRGGRFDGDGRGMATILLMGGAVICIIGVIMEIAMSVSYLFQAMSIVDSQITAIGSVITELGIALFLIGLILWLLRSRQGFGSGSGVS